MLGTMLPDPAHLLARSTVFGVLTTEEREGLVRGGREQRLAAGTDLFHAGDACEQVQVLLRGTVRLWRLTDDGHVLALRVCEPGEVLGQMSALSPDGVHSVNATAQEECRLLAFPSEAFRQLLAGRPAVAVQLASALAERVRGLSDELEAIKFGSIAERVLTWLQRGGERRREIVVTHQEIAEQVGSGRGRIEILDHDGLAHARL
jgi:CRP/FNR family transcriptional regulator